MGCPLAAAVMTWHLATGRVAKAFANAGPSSLPTAGYTTVATEQTLPVRLPPTRTAPSVSAPSPSLCNSFIHDILPSRGYPLSTRIGVKLVR